MPHSHRATYDADGNIILPAEDRTQCIEAASLPAQAEATARITERFPTESLLAVQRELSSVMQGLLTEGASQVRASVYDSRTFGQRFRKAVKTCAATTKEFLLQPVWIPGRKNTVKQRSRGALFVLDVVRFGTTFACIFVLLFVALNAQSFWQILRSDLQPIALEDASANGDINAALRDKLKSIPGLSVAGADAKDTLLAFLPEVGPPENRLIIPKLNLNVPLVQPAFTALLKEDWPQVEKDIQQALEGGVVHYPGTARPGQAGNFFVTGHSSYYPWSAGNYKTVFARLHQLNVGDEYWVYYGGDKHRYIVVEKKEVSPADISVLDQPTGQRMATLMTCTPVGTTLRRLIVLAQEIDSVSGEPMEIGERGVRSEPAKGVPLEALPI